MLTPSAPLITATARLAAASMTCSQLSSMSSIRLSSSPALDRRAGRWRWIASPRRTLQALKLAVADLQERGIPSDVAAALKETQNQRTAMVRLTPALSGVSPVALKRPSASARRVGA